MLPKNAVVKARKAIESTYSGTCTITEYQEYVKENRSTGHREVVVKDNLPCRLSFSSSQAAGQGETASSLNQNIKLFLSPDVVINPGSKITVTQNGVATEYKNSGVPAVYPTHQEIILELFRRWA